MADEDKLIDLIALTKRGQADAQEKLVLHAQARLRTYVYRVTLDPNVTDDIVQEALLAMVKSLGELKNVRRFKGWLYAIAQSKIAGHYRNVQKRDAIRSSVHYKNILEKRHRSSQIDVVDQLLEKELSKAVIDAMAELNQNHRAVLTLRCFEMLDFDDIAVAMGSTNITARITFCRARDALRNRLAKRGLDKSLLVFSLGLFGQATAPSEAAGAAVAVAPASANVGIATAVVSTLTGKFGLAALCALLMGLGLWGGYSRFSASAGQPLPERHQVTSVHYTVHVAGNSPAAPASMSSGAYEQSYYFPDGLRRAFFMRMQRWHPQQNRELCTWLQNAHANYYYNPDTQRIYINNSRVPTFNLAVRLLPTDTPEFWNFVQHVQGETQGVRYSRDASTGLLVSAVDRRFLDAPLYRTDYRYNTVDKELFEFSWPASVPITDLRDAMHKRGWTYFRIVGQINGRPIRGRGRIPFVYAKYQSNWPWMVLSIGDSLELLDSVDGAFIRDPDGPVLARYPAGTFFKGLARPWRGMHTMDIVRRDAAQERIWFNTTQTEDGKHTIVTLVDKRPDTTTDLTYTIDFNNDIIKSITFRVDARSVGQMTFDHLQDIKALDTEFAEPNLADSFDFTTREDPGVLWLMWLAKQELVPQLRRKDAFVATEK